MTLDDWSPAARSCWGKTDPGSGQSLPLVQHLEDAAGVMAELWRLQPDNVRRLFADALGGEQSALSFVCFAAGTHDVGKAASHFAFKAYLVGMPSLADDMVGRGLSMPTVIAHPHPHGVIGQAHILDWSQRRHGAKWLKAQRLAGIAGGHHGRNPTPQDLRDAQVVLSSEADAWRDVRDEILDRMSARTGADAYLPAWFATDIPVTVQVLTTALVIMADWIASDERLFPYTDHGATRQRVDRALRHLSLPRAWHLEPPPDDVSAQFGGRFPDLAGASPNAMQAAVVAAAREMREPGLLVIEAPMGMGKTEAAMLAAEILSWRFGMGGVFIGLPTMATSNPMFTRIHKWLGEVASAGPTSITLAHSKAGLNDDYQGLMPWARARSVFDDEGSDNQQTALKEAAVLVHSWFLGRKRGILAQHVVGTIDQSLFAALKAKHVVLRHLGLASKVVIIDEVHAADDYMRVYLKRVLEWLGAYGTPVVLMSATLPPAQRQDLVNAYLEGRGRAQVDLAASPDAYPLVTVAAESVRQVPVPVEAVPTQVDIVLHDDDVNSLVETVRGLVTGGGCVGVIRNTVARAQEAFAALEAALDCEVVLLHSRFLAPHRAARERDLVERLGRDGKRRPEKLVVVGTQVLEQSLDIDFDALVSDLAPVDLVLQRIGRLHRHDRVRPAGLEKATCYLTGVEDWSAAPPSFPSGSCHVYGQDALLRASAVFRDQRVIRLPEAIPALVARAYLPRADVPDAWAAAAREAHMAREKKRQWRQDGASAFLLADPIRTSNLNALIEGSAGDPDDTRGYRQVRDSEDSLEVIMVVKTADGLRLPEDVGEFSGSHLTQLAAPDTEVARAAAACTITLPLTLSGKWIIDRIISELEKSVDLSAWQTSPWLKGQLVLALDESGTGRIAGYDVRYDQRQGLIAEPTSQGAAQ